MNAIRPIDHIVWDWNGTLLGDSGAIIDATIAAFAACGLPSVTAAEYRRRHTQPISEFYNRLAGRRLSDEEQARLLTCFHTAYGRRRKLVSLAVDAVEALSLWAEAGRRQSLLSMYPHDLLMPMVTGTGIGHFFARVDGTDGVDIASKAPHLSRHLKQLGVSPKRVLVIGDSIDDARAARACGAHSVLYHSGENALHLREHFAEVGVPVVTTLRGAVEDLLSGCGQDAGTPSDVGRPVVAPAGEELGCIPDVGRSCRPAGDARQ